MPVKDKKMSLTASEYVFLANAVYQAPDQQKAIESISLASENKWDSNDYKVLEGDADYMVFQKISTDSIVVACRGTANTSDIIPDLYIAMGLLRLHPRSKKILAVVDRYKTLFRDVSVTGHSLGGKLAALIGASEGVLAVTFNQGSSPLDSNSIVTEIQTDMYGYDYDNVIHFTTCTDFVSTSECLKQNNQTIIVTPPSMINALANHGLGNFFSIDQEGSTEISQRQEVLREKRATEPIEENVVQRHEAALEDMRNALNAYRMNKDWFDKNVLSGEQTEEMESLLISDPERGIYGIDTSKLTELEDFRVFIQGLDGIGNVERAMDYFKKAYNAENLSISDATNRTIQTMVDKGLDVDIEKLQQRVAQYTEQEGKVPLATDAPVNVTTTATVTDEELAMEYFKKAWNVENLSIEDATNRAIQTMVEEGRDIDIDIFRERVAKYAATEHKTGDPTSIHYGKDKNLHDKTHAVEDLDSIDPVLPGEDNGEGLGFPNEDVPPGEDNGEGLGFPNEDLPPGEDNGEGLGFPDEDVPPDKTHAVDDLEPIDPVPPGGNDVVGGGGNAVNNYRNITLTEEEWKARLMRGVEGETTTANKIARFKENLKDLEGVAPPEFIEEVNVSLGKMSAIEKLAGAMERFGLPETAAAFRATAGRISQSLARRLSSFMNMERFIGIGATRFTRAIGTTVRMGDVVKSVVKCFDIITIAVMGVLLVSEIADVVIGANEIAKLRDMVKNPDLSFLRFRVEQAISRLENIRIWKSFKAGVHATEFLVGVLVTIFAPYAAGPTWVGIGVQQLSEIPMDAMLSDNIRNDFLQFWYGSSETPSFMYYIRRRDVDANNHGEVTNVEEWVNWVVDGMNIESYNFEGKLKLKLDQINSNLWRDVSAIIEDPSSVPGLTDDRYDRLLVLRSQYPQTHWNNVLHRLSLERQSNYMGGGHSATMSTDSLTDYITKFDTVGYEQLFSYGRTHETPTTVQEYEDLKNYLKLKKLHWGFQSEKGLDQDYIDAGGKPQGDRETDEEFERRVVTWQHEQILNDITAANVNSEKRNEERAKDDFEAILRSEYPNWDFDKNQPKYTMADVTCRKVYKNSSLAPSTSTSIVPSNRRRLIPDAWVAPRKRTKLDLSSAVTPF